MFCAPGFVVTTTKWDGQIGSFGKGVGWSLTRTRRELAERYGEFGEVRSQVRVSGPPIRRGGAVTVVDDSKIV